MKNRHLPFWLRLPAFLPIYLWEMIKSNLRVAADVLRPRPDFKPGFLELDLSAYDPMQRWAASCLISMTPGTLALDLDEASGTMLVHVLYSHNPGEECRELHKLLQRALGPASNPAP